MADEEKKKCYPTYRCTRCTCTFFKMDKPAVEEDLATLAMNPFSVTRVNDLHRVLLHHCDDSGVGMASLVGITPEDAVEKLTKPPKPKPNETDEGLN